MAGREPTQARFRKGPAPVNDFPDAPRLFFAGSRLARRLLALSGWRVAFEGLPGPQGVLAVYPHTSNWDFVVMILAKWSVGVPARFWGKDRLFRVPLLGAWLRWLGGVPVDRTSPRGVVGQTVDDMVSCRVRGECFWLGLAPEGTRKALPGWRTGACQTALGAEVPLGLIRLDYAAREVRVLDFIRLSGDTEADFRRIAAVYEGVQGFCPQRMSPVRPLPAEIPRTETIVP